MEEEHQDCARIPRPVSAAVRPRQGRGAHRPLAAAARQERQLGAAQRSACLLVVLACLWICCWPAAAALLGLARFWPDSGLTLAWLWPGSGPTLALPTQARLRPDSGLQWPVAAEADCRCVEASAHSLSKIEAWVGAENSKAFARAGGSLAQMRQAAVRLSPSMIATASTHAPPCRPVAGDRGRASGRSLQWPCRPRSGPWRRPRAWASGKSKIIESSTCIKA